MHCVVQTIMYLWVWVFMKFLKTLTRAAKTKRRRDEEDYGICLKPWQRAGQGPVLSRQQHPFQQFLPTNTSLGLCKQMGGTQLTRCGSEWYRCRTWPPAQGEVNFHQKSTRVSPLLKFLSFSDCRQFQQHGLKDLHPDSGLFCVKLYILLEFSRSAGGNLNNLLAWLFF